jgi:membrane-associated phospholipid phosphatase
MDADITGAARTLADHAVLLLGLGIGALAAAFAITFAAVRVAARHRAALTAALAWCLRQVLRVPVIGPAFGKARASVPSSFVVLHLVLGLIATVAIVAFAIIAEEMAAGRAVVAFDHAFADAMAEHTSPEWRRVFGWITALGSPVALTIGSATVAGVLLWRRQYVPAVGCIIAQAGAGVLSLTLKEAFARSRPNGAYVSQLASGWSFPSGHALGTFVFCGVGAYLVYRYARSWMTTAIVVCIAFSWCLIMGFTRLYLGAHFLSDVAAGLVAATAWVAVCVSGMEIGLRRTRRTV